MAVFLDIHNCKNTDMEPGIFYIPKTFLIKVIYMLCILLFCTFCACGVTIEGIFHSLFFCLPLVVLHKCN